MRCRLARDKLLWGLSSLAARYPILHSAILPIHQAAFGEMHHFLGREPPGGLQTGDSLRRVRFHRESPRKFNFIGYGFPGHLSFGPETTAPVHGFITITCIEAQSMLDAAPVLGSGLRVQVPVTVSSKLVPCATDTGPDTTGERPAEPNPHGS